MPEQFKKIDNQELELSKIKPTKVNIPKPIELTSQQDENLLGLANKAKQAEGQGDLKTAIEFYQEYKDEYLKLKKESRKEKIHLREKEDDQEFQKKAIDYMQTLLSQGADKNYVAIGLAGLDSDKAWEMRETLLSQGANKDWVAMGLAGLDSDKAWEMRETLLSQGAGKDYVARGLAGLDSDKAWEMRETLLSQGANKNYVAEGLSGLDSDKAWEMREILLSQGADKGWVAIGLAGLDSDKAWEMRETFLSQGANKDWVARGIYGDYLMAGVRKARRDRVEKE